jgi:hypothetical protein
MEIECAPETVLSLCLVPVTICPAAQVQIVAHYSSTSGSATLPNTPIVGRLGHYR